MDMISLIKLIRYYQLQLLNVKTILQINGRPNVVKEATWGRNWRKIVTLTVKI